MAQESCHGGFCARSL